MSVSENMLTLLERLGLNVKITPGGAFTDLMTLEEYLKFKPRKVYR